MTALIDYAGIFPPASLTLPAAIDEYISHQRQRESWMLSRFIIPARRLAELNSAQLSQLPNWRFSALGQGGDAENWLENLGADVGLVDDFRRKFGEVVAVDLFETRLPAFSTPADLSALLAEADKLLAGIQPFYEIPFGADWERRFLNGVEGVAAHNNNRDGNRAGIKLRTGGVKAEMFPSVGQVALAIDACRNAGIPLKATAGLHHPIRHYNDAVGAKMHGFLNLFGAGILAVVHFINRSQIEAILADEQADQFVFTDNQFRWGALAATADQIAACRADHLISYGSCSFDEPWADLQTLGLLPASNSIPSPQNKE